MKLYCIHDVLYDYYGGMVNIKAESLEQCRELFLNYLNTSFTELTVQGFLIDFDLAVRDKKYTEYELSTTDTNPTGVNDIIFGGS